jgi:acetyl-CoA carboxylase carboxyl transferase subunit alpha
MPAEPSGKPMSPAVPHLSRNLVFERPIVALAQRLAEFEALHGQNGCELSGEILELRDRLAALTHQIYGTLRPWETVQVARHPQRPSTAYYVRQFVESFTELHGDRSFRDDPAMITGFGRITGKNVMIVGHMKGQDVRERVKRCFGCAHPEGYRKALLKMRLAAKFHVPVVCLVDTPGAYPGVGAEERGQAQAIAVNLMEMSRLPTPIIVIVLGEGGSGGALGVGVGDRVAMMEHAYYSVISPEGCAAILWKNGAFAPHAAACLKLTARDLRGLDLIDDIISEPPGGAHRDPAQAARDLEQYIARTLDQVQYVHTRLLLDRRYERLRAKGRFLDARRPTAHCSQHSCKNLSRPHELHADAEPLRTGAPVTDTVQEVALARARTPNPRIRNPFV